MVMHVHVAVAGTGWAKLRIAHNAQDARKNGLQHINNNHPNATAKEPQSRSAGHARVFAASGSQATVATARESPHQLG
jgi:hypothetical protein